MTIKQDYNKILEGCGESIFGVMKIKGIYNDEAVVNCGDKDIDFIKFEKDKYEVKQTDRVLLCPSCQAKKEVFLERCKDELRFLKSLDKGIEIISYYKKIYLPKTPSIKERISQLKEVLEEENEKK